MMKPLFVVVLSVFLVLAVVPVVGAAELVVTPLVRLQTGDFTFALKNGDTELWKFSVGQPLATVGLEAGYGNLALHAYAGASGVTSSDPDDGFMAWSTGTDTIGESRVAGADVGYKLSLGSFDLVPTLGYHSALFVSGRKYAHEGGFTGHTAGLEVKGFRLGLEGRTILGDKLDARAAVGVGLGTKVLELEADYYNHPDGGEYETDWYRWEVLDQSASLMDANLSLGYQLSDAFTVRAGYRWSQGSVKFSDPSETWGWSSSTWPVDKYDSYGFGSNALYVEGTYRF